MRKLLKQTPSLLVSALFLIGNYANAQNLTADYESIPDLFAGYTIPVELGIMKFEGCDNFEELLYDELRVNNIITEKFSIIPFENLQRNREILGLNKIEPSSKVLKKLIEIYKIKFIIIGSGTGNDNFTLKIIRSEDSKEVFSNNYQSSSNSTTLKDVTKLFSETKKAVYKDKLITKQEKSTKVSNDMVYVEGGTFEMGSSTGDSDEKPVHTVIISSFYIDKYEVTQREYEEVMGNNPSYNKCSECPVVNVSWEEANEYARKIGKRLPTEAEWEYAARGGNKSKGYRYSGSNDIDDIAWYGGNSSNQTHKVGTKKANEIGIYDMSGNVWEWCSDWYDRNYYDKSPSQNPEGPRSGTYRVLRGGSWFNHDYDCRVSNRHWNNPAYRIINYGFRCAR